MTSNRMEAKPRAGEHGRFCGDATAPLVTTPCCEPWICCDTAFSVARGGRKWSIAPACVIPTMRTSMAARGKAVRSAVLVTTMTKGMRKPRSLAKILSSGGRSTRSKLGTKDARYRASLDSLDESMSRIFWGQLPKSLQSDLKSDSLFRYDRQENVFMKLICSCS
jgi:hypothetical protein